jgi:hypothetical protein
MIFSPVACECKAWIRLRERKTRMGKQKGLPPPGKAAKMEVGQKIPWASLNPGFHAALITRLLPILRNLRDNKHLPKLLGFVRKGNQ